LVSQFYHFSTFFYLFLKLDRKRKEKRCNIAGPNLVQAAQQWAEARPRPRARGNFALRPSGFWVSGNKFLYCFYVSLTVYRNTLQLLFLYATRPRRRSRAERLRRGPGPADWGYDRRSRAVDIKSDLPRVFSPT
jgi:hypothetical protein